MSLNSSLIYNQLPLSSSDHLRRFIPIRDHRRKWKRRRLKPYRCQFSPIPIEAMYDNLISQIPSLNVNSLQILAPALGLASGIAVYLSKFDPRKSENNSVSSIGEWILFTSPTPFNRFVILRCRSIALEGGELAEDVNERLVKEERHFVRLNSGTIEVREGENERSNEEKKLVYQRVCVTTEDGGVISLDWPANLDLEDERGFDTTMVIVPGTAEGSMERSVKEFVCECLRRGCFPVVMNPRGCAGSPLTTARLFTAADSDDVSTAIEFIKRARPWTTLMAVGWGYGANMLTKYLAEVGEKTPLTAATCINNPFDLEEATRSSPHRITFDENLTVGLVDILRSNKEMFQGRAKGYDIEKALSSSSIRDFERTISMVSYGFDALEDFYAKSSTRDVVGKVKIPVLFIQNDDGSVPLFSVPRGLIAENPFTSLLLCSCLPSSNFSVSRSTLSWCQNLTIEWLTAVELGLLKGRHPLLKDVDVTINPSKGLSLVDGRASSSKNGRGNKRQNFLKSNESNAHSSNALQKMPGDRDTVASIDRRPSSDLNRVPQLQPKGLSHENNGVSQQSDAIDAEVAEEEGVNDVDSDRGQVVQTARVVVNMLDETVPDTLTEEQKEKVLTAVSRGESLITALQDAVPEDVRGNLTNAVSSILQSQSSNLKFDGLLRLGNISDVASQLKSKVQEKVKPSSAEDAKVQEKVKPSNAEDAKVQEKVQPSNAEDGSEDSHSSSKTIKSDDLADASISQPSTEKPLEGLESDFQASEHLNKPSDTDESQLKASDESDTPALEKGTDVLGNNNDATDEPEAGNKPETSFQSEGEDGTQDSSIDGDKVMLDDGGNQQPVKEEDANKLKEENTVDSSVDDSKATVTTQPEDKSLPPPIPSEAPSMEKEASDDQKKDENNTQPIQNQDNSSPPSFSVTQAFDAFTGIDDSTQVAVNSVFGVIENMITQFEDEREKSESKDEGSAEDQKVGSAPKEHVDHKHHKVDGSKTIPSDLADNSSNNHLDSDERLTVEPATSDDNHGDISQKIDTKDNIGEDGTRGDVIYKELSPDKSVKALNCTSQNSLYISPNSGNALYKENLQSYLPSKVGKTKSLDLDSTTALFLEYFPEEGKWKFLDQTENENDSIDIATDEAWTHMPLEAEETGDIIEPSYIMLDGKRLEADECEELDELDNSDDENACDGSISFLKSAIVEALKIEVGRRLSDTDLQEMESHLARDMDQVANAIHLALGDEERLSIMKDTDNSSDEVSIHQGEDIASAISSAVMETDYLRRVLPVGVIVGSCLASLRKYVNVTSINSNAENEDLQLNQVKTRKPAKVIPREVDSKYELDSSDTKYEEEDDMSFSNGNAAMVGAVTAATAALGASALLGHQQDSQNIGDSAQFFSDNKDPSKSEEEMSDTTHGNIVTSLAEKAMSVAGPVVPTKEGGEVDQERLVAMLAELGQRGGFLRLIGKLALLWGGIRGAMSLTEKLLSFLRFSERPLYQRFFGFIGMVLVLWSPVVVPLLPSLVQGWTTGNSAKFAELGCVIGLYASILVLIMSWGRRVRGYGNPLDQYGLDLNSLAKVNFMKGLIGGVILVLVIHSSNCLLLGCVNFHWPSTLPSSSLGAGKLLKFYGEMFILLLRGVATATGVALVEELLFRSWLPNEIAVDFGYHRGIIISGLAFSLSQRSPWEIPGLWLLSLALSGARERTKGNLFLPVGLRAGILASSYILQRGGFLIYKPTFPLWVTGTLPYQPFSGVIGIAFSLVLAIILYPRQPHDANKLTRTTGQ